MNVIECCYRNQLPKNPYKQQRNISFANDFEVKEFPQFGKRFRAGRIEKRNVEIEPSKFPYRMNHILDLCNVHTLFCSFDASHKQKEKKRTEKNRKKKM